MGAQYAFYAAPRNDGEAGVALSNDRLIDGSDTRPGADVQRRASEYDQRLV
jgi:hypothetical protein